MAAVMDQGEVGFLAGSAPCGRVPGATRTCRYATRTGPCVRRPGGGRPRSPCRGRLQVCCPLATGWSVAQSVCRALGLGAWLRCPSEYLWPSLRRPWPSPRGSPGAVAAGLLGGQLRMSSGRKPPLTGSRPRCTRTIRGGCGHAGGHFTTALTTREIAGVRRRHHLHLSTLRPPSPADWQDTCRMPVQGGGGGCSPCRTGAVAAVSRASGSAGEHAES